MGASQLRDGMPLVIQLELLARVGLALLIGAVLGLERELAGKRAGTRTHILVAMAAAMSTGVGSTLVGASGDPTRVLHGVITGVGFIGAGAIVMSKKQQGATGLTTASTVLLVATMGAACGLGEWLVATGGAALALLSLRGTHSIENRVKRIVDSRGGGEEDSD